MNTKTRSTEDEYDYNAEASRAHGVRRKGEKKPPPPGKVKVTHTRKGMGLELLDKAQLMYLSTVGIVGEFMLFDSLSDPYRAHAMWSFGIATIVSSLACFLRKRE